MSNEPELGISYREIDTPALLVDLDLFQRNLSQMARFFADRSASLRPHAKTHKCPQIALRQLEAGAIGITCAKVGEAEVMAQAGVRDILIANEVVGKTKIGRLTELARQSDMMVAVDNPQNVDALSSACVEKGVSLRVLVEIDIGMKRCGVQPGAEALALAQKVDTASRLSLAGLMGYEGHLVMVADPDERATRVRDAVSRLGETADLLEQNGLSAQIVSGGGTGTYDITGTCAPITEVQAGSYVFMDTTYLKVRPEFAPSLTVLATVVSRPTPDRLVTDAGRKTISNDFGLPQPLEVPGASVRSLSEEHGIIELAAPAEVDLKPGDKISFIPSHCCTTVNLYNDFYIIQGGKLVDIWPIAARGRSQ